MTSFILILFKKKDVNAIFSFIMINTILWLKFTE